MESMKMGPLGAASKSAMLPVIHVIILDEGLVVVTLLRDAMFL